MRTYEPLPGTRIDQAAAEAYGMCLKANRIIDFDFNGKTLFASPAQTAEECRIKCRSELGLPAVDPPFHPVTTLDALARWDKGDSVFTVEMGGLGPSYEQAIQILVFELIRDMHDKPSPEGNGFGDWGDPTVRRINKKCGGFSGAQVVSAKRIAYLAIRDGWAKMLKSAPNNRMIQVSKQFPSL